MAIPFASCSTSCVVPSVCEIECVVPYPPLPQSSPLHEYVSVTHLPQAPQGQAWGASALPSLLWHGRDARSATHTYQPELPS